MSGHSEHIPSLAFVQLIGYVTAMAGKLTLYNTAVIIEPGVAKHKMALLKLYSTAFSDFSRCCDLCQDDDTVPQDLKDLVSMHGLVANRQLYTDEQPSLTLTKVYQTNVSFLVRIEMVSEQSIASLFSTKFMLQTPLVKIRVYCPFKNDDGQQCKAGFTTKFFVLQRHIAKTHPSKSECMTVHLVRDISDLSLHLNISG